MPKCYTSCIRKRRRRVSRSEGTGRPIRATRSRLQVRRFIASKFLTDTQTRATSVGFSMNNTERAHTGLSDNKIVRYKSMNYLSFVTRFQLIRSGVPLEVCASISDTDVWLEDSPFVYDKTRWTTTAPETKKNKHPSTSVISSLNLDKQPTSNSSKTSSSYCNVHLNSTEIDVFDAMGKMKTTGSGAIFATSVNCFQRRTPISKEAYHVKSEAYTLEFNPSLKRPNQTDHVGKSVSFDCLRSPEAREAASAAETLVALANNNRIAQTKATPQMGHEDQARPTPTEPTFETINISDLNGASELDKPPLLKACDISDTCYEIRSFDSCPLDLSTKSKLTSDEGTITSLATLLVDPSNQVVDGQVCFDSKDVQLLDVALISSNQNLISETPSEKLTLKYEDSEVERFERSAHDFALDANGNKIHKCRICNKVFTVMAAFQCHVTTHYKQKNKCMVCGKHFSRSWLLKGHMRTHTGERPYRCSHPGCDKAFADKSNLRSHSLIHSSMGKTFVCLKCNRAFAQKRYLHKHRLEVCKS